MFIRSERLFLRPGWSEDCEELGSRIDEGVVVRTAHKLFAPASLNIHDRHLPRFLVTLPDGEGTRVIGCVGLLDEEHSAELIYWISPEYWGQGYATEAGEAVLSLARTLGYRQITAHDFVDNAASKRVLGKLGFRVTGETCLRLCLARGALGMSRVHRRELGQPSDSDGSATDFGNDGARHAA